MFSFDAELLVVVPVVTEVGCSGGEHGDGSFDGPAGAGAVQAVSDDMAAGAFDHAAGNRVALTQALVVRHAVAVVREVGDCRCDRFCDRFGDSTFGECLSQSADHSSDVA